jgi:hypothetical protein
MAIWNIVSELCKIKSYLVYFVVIWYTSACFGTLYQEKSGNRACHAAKKILEPQSAQIPGPFKKYFNTFLFSTKNWNAIDFIRNLQKIKIKIWQVIIL